MQMNGCRNYSDSTAQIHFPPRSSLNPRIHKNAQFPRTPAIFQRQMNTNDTYSLILVGRHGRKRCLGEYEAAIAGVLMLLLICGGTVFRRQIHDVESGLVSVH